jgi:hypothetical protein
MKTTSRNINVSVLQPAQQIKEKFVVVMEELISIGTF